MGAEATLYLTARGVQVVGTDVWSWDAPFSHTARRWAETRDPSIIWEGHKAGRIRPYYQIEKLTNLAALPATGWTLSCFPVTIERASAGWIRAVALGEGSAGGDRDRGGAGAWVVCLRQSRLTSGHLLLKDSQAC